MNQWIQRLSEVAARPNRLIIGLMSGTSLDGLDLALCRVTGSGEETRPELLKFKTVDYPSDIAGRLREFTSVDEVSLEEVCLAHTWLGQYHADLLLEALAEWGREPMEIDAVASHGQTIYHAPVVQHRRKGMPNATLQIADGDHIARKTGIITVSDFRQKHTAAGGEGAPMVSLVDRLLYTDSVENRFLLNIGGIANFAFLPARQSEAEYVTTDTGPGNTLINAAASELFDLDYDRDGEIAAAGSVDATLLRVMKQDPYFNEPLPKSTGPELFNRAWIGRMQQEAGRTGIEPSDLVATLTWLTAETIADQVRTVADLLEPDVPTAVYLSGGGMHNRTLVTWLEQLLEGVRLEPFDRIGYPADAKEAVSFAVLANETLAGEGFLFNPKQGTERRVNFGKISLPG